MDVAVVDSGHHHPPVQVDDLGGRTDKAPDPCDAPGVDDPSGGHRYGTCHGIGPVERVDVAVAENGLGRCRRPLPPGSNRATEQSAARQRGAALDELTP
jgi:hypothetical protein